MATKTPETTTALAKPSTGMSPEDEAALTKREVALQFISLMQGKSTAVESNEPKGIRSGDYLLGGRTRIPAFKEGPGFVVVVGISRPAAVYFNKDGKKELDSHDPKSPEWAKIIAAAAAGETRAKSGIEVLVWLTEHDSHGVMAFLGNARDESKPLIACRDAKVPALITSKQVGKNKFFVPEITPAPKGHAIKLPTPEQAAKALAFFEAYKLEKPAPEPAANARPR